MEDMGPLLSEVAMEITFLSDTETNKRTRPTKLTTTTTLRMITKLTTLTSKSGGIRKTANTNTSNRNTESTHKSNLIMVTVDTTAQDMEVMPTAVTENLI